MAGGTALRGAARARGWLALMALALCLPAAAGRRNRDALPEPEPEPEPVLTATPEPEPEPVPRIEDLFPPDRPFDAGPLPPGLPNASAQACAACHVAAWEDWSRSAHARGGTPAFHEAVADAGTPACLVCHLPLAQQHPSTVVFDVADPSRPLHRANGHVDLSLRAEAVTCAACHVREGAVIGTNGRLESPHPVRVADALGSSEGCAACHQLTWPGADQPLYDTFGEWQRSAHAAAGIGCADCHFSAGVDAVGDHAMPSRGGQGLSVLLTASGLSAARGGEPLDVAITLQNSGAGHALPTGSPFEAWVIEAWLEGPPTRRGQAPQRVAPFEERLARTLEASAPWRTVADTRLAPQEERRLAWAPALPQGAAEGEWALVVRLVEEIRGRRAAEAAREWRFPLDVD